jgi:hypothetical protein
MAGMTTLASPGSRPQPEQLLGLAVERAYTAFAGNRLGSSMAVRRHDVTSEEVAALGGPARSVSAAAIDRWLPHAVTTWGSARDLRALLPRVLELLTAGLLTTAPEVLFGKLRQARSTSWPAEEQAALEHVLAALWLTTLSRHPSPVGIPADRVLTSLAELGRAVSPYLEDWKRVLAAGSAESDAARRHLQDLARRVEILHSTGLGVGDLFWSPHPDEAAALDAWLTSASTQAWLGR